MAKHILEGKVPLLYYGQHHIGSFEAFVASFNFLIMGISSTSVKMVPFLFSVLLIPLIYRLAYELFDERVALMSALYIAVPPSFLAVWSLKARGGHVETVFFGTLILLMTVLWIKDQRYDRSNVRFALSLGVVWGLAWWSNPLVVSYLIVSALLLLAHMVHVLEARSERPILSNIMEQWKKAFFGRLWLVCMIVLFSFLLLTLAAICWILLFGDGTIVFGRTIGTHSLYPLVIMAIGLAICTTVVLSIVRTETWPWFYLLLGFSIGSLPYWAYFAVENIPPIGELVSREGISLSDSFSNLRQLFGVGIPILLGGRQEWSTKDLLPLLSPCVYLLSVSALAYFFWRYKRSFLPVLSVQDRKALGVKLVFLMLVVFSLTFSISKFGWFALEPRYLLPLHSVLPLIFGVFLANTYSASRFAFSVLLALLLSCHVLGLCVTRTPRHGGEGKEQELISFLMKKNLVYGYADYWLSYRLTFLSDERVIIAPLRLGNDRYPRYREMIERAPSVCLILTDRRELAKWKGKIFRREDKYRTKNVGPFLILYGVRQGKGEAQKRTPSSSFAVELPGQTSRSTLPSSPLIALR